MGRWFLFILSIVGSLCCGMARRSHFNLVALEIDCGMERGFKRIYFNDWFMVLLCVWEAGFFCCLECL